MPELKLKPPFEIGQIVYLKSDPDQLDRMVTGIYVNCSGMQYELRHADNDATIHSFIEIITKKEKD